MVVMAGDFNAWVIDWGSSETDKRGQNLLETFFYLNLVLLNSGGFSTYRKGNSSSIIDLTFVSNVLAKKVNSWRVDEEFTNSDHQAIVWEFYVNPARPKISNVDEHRAGWNSRKFNKKSFVVMINDNRLTPIVMEPTTKMGP